MNEEGQPLLVYFCVGKDVECCPLTLLTLRTSSSDLAAALCFSLNIPCVGFYGSLMPALLLCGDQPLLLLPEAQLSQDVFVS